MKRANKIFFRCCHEYLLSKLREARNNGKVSGSLYCKDCKREYGVSYYSVKTDAFVIFYQKYIYIFRTKRDPTDKEFSVMETLMPADFAIITDIDRLLNPLVQNNFLSPQGADLYIGAYSDIKDYLSEMENIDNGKPLIQKDFRFIELLTIFMEQAYEKNRIAMLKLKAKALLRKQREKSTNNTEQQGTNSAEGLSNNDDITQ